jgi:hypothetical protein
LAGGVKMNTTVAALTLTVPPLVEVPVWVRLARPGR